MVDGGSVLEKCISSQQRRGKGRGRGGKKKKKKKTENEELRQRRKIQAGNPRKVKMKRRTNF